MFVKGKGCSVNLLHHLQGFQHHLPGVGTWTTLLGHLLGSVMECEAQTWRFRELELLLCNPWRN